MKKRIAFFAFILMASASFAQNGLNHVFVQRGIDGDQVSVRVNLAGPGANDVQNVDMTFSNSLDCRICTNLTFQTSPSAGNSWEGGGIASNAYGLLDRGIITIQHNNGDITRWAIAFNLGTGTRTSSSQANNKAELL